MVLFDQDLIRMTFIVGIAVSVWLYEKTHTTTGSLVVPGYVGAQLLNPLALFTTGLNAIATYYLVSVVLPRFAAVYGRSRFVVNILVSILITLVTGPVLNSVTGPSVPLLDTIGYVIPALIAYDMNRQSPGKTGAAVIMSGALAASPALVLVLLSPGRVDPVLPVETGLYAVGDVWFPIVALVSTLVAATLFHNHALRAGGFIGSMYLGLSAVRPEHVVYFLVLAVAIYGIVHVGLRRVMILFGRRKFATMLMVGSLMSWFALELLEVTMPGRLDIAGLPVAALFVPAVLANDMERTSVGEVLLGCSIAAGATLSITVVVSGVVDQRSIPEWAVPLLVLSMSALLWPQFESLVLKVVATGTTALRPERLRPIAAAVSDAVADAVTAAASPAFATTVAVSDVAHAVDVGDEPHNSSLALSLFDSRTSERPLPGDRMAPAELAMYLSLRTRITVETAEQESYDLSAAEDLRALASADEFVPKDELDAELEQLLSDAAEDEFVPKDELDAELEQLLSDVAEIWSEEDERTLSSFVASDEIGWKSHGDDDSDWSTFDDDERSTPRADAVTR